MLQNDVAQLMGGCETLDMQSTAGRYHDARARKGAGRHSPKAEFSGLNTNGMPRSAITSKISMEPPPSVTRSRIEFAMDSAAPQQHQRQFALPPT